MQHQKLTSVGLNYRWLWHGVLSSIILKIVRIQYKGIVIFSYLYLVPSVVLVTGSKFQNQKIKFHRAMLQYLTCCNCNVAIFQCICRLKMVRNLVNIYHSTYSICICGCSLDCFHCYQVGYQKILTLSYIDKFVDDVHKLFRDAYRQKLEKAGFVKMIKLEFDFEEKFQKMLR